MFHRDPVTGETVSSEPLNAYPWGVFDIRPPAVRTFAVRWFKSRTRAENAARHPNAGGKSNFAVGGWEGRQ